jgi:CheY-like chemotaxis protein
MIVDDQNDIRFSVKTLLEKKGYSVVTADNGNDCLKKLKKKKVDLILLDIMMPGMPIRELIKKIKTIKIAFLSAVLMSDKEKKSLLRGNIVGFIQKPASNDELINQIKMMVE